MNLSTKLLDGKRAAVLPQTFLHDGVNPPQEISPLTGRPIANGPPPSAGVSSVSSFAALPPPPVPLPGPQPEPSDFMSRVAELLQAQEQRLRAMWGPPGLPAVIPAPMPTPPTANAAVSPAFKVIFELETGDTAEAYYDDVLQVESTLVLCTDRARPACTVYRPGRRLDTPVAVRVDNLQAQTRQAYLCLVPGTRFEHRNMEYVLLVVADARDLPLTG